MAERRILLDVATDPGLTVVHRASDGERDEVIAVLRERLSEGRLSQDTFIARVDRALQARTRAELEGLLDDLPEAPARFGAPPVRPPGIVDRLAGLVESAASFSRRMRLAWDRGRVPQLVLPPDGAKRVTVGRAPSSDLLLADDGVSRYHADFYLHKGRWLLVDLGSTNGTRVNGWRISDPTPVNVGDLVTFGRLSFRITEQL